MQTSWKVSYGNRGRASVSLDDTYSTRTGTVQRTVLYSTVTDRVHGRLRVASGFASGQVRVRPGVTSVGSPMVPTPLTGHVIR